MEIDEEDEEVDIEEERERHEEVMDVLPSASVTVLYMLKLCLPFLPLKDIKRLSSVNLFHSPSRSAQGAELPGFKKKGLGKRMVGALPDVAETSEDEPEEKNGRNSAQLANGPPQAAMSLVSINVISAICMDPVSSPSLQWQVYEKLKKMGDGLLTRSTKVQEFISQLEAAMGDNENKRVRKLLGFRKMYRYCRAQFYAQLIPLWPRSITALEEVVQLLDEQYEVVQSVRADAEPLKAYDSGPISDQLKKSLA